MFRAAGLAFRVSLSAIVSGLVLFALDRLHCDGITAGLVLILPIYGSALYWGWREALAAAAVAGFGLEHLFLHQQWLGLSMFLSVALITSWTAARSKRQRLEAEPAARLDPSDLAADARRYDELKSRAFEEVIHETRSSLHCIGLAATTLLSAKPGNPAQQRQLLCAIQEEVERIEQAGAKLRKQRPESNPSEAAPSAHSLEDLVAAAKEALDPESRARLLVRIPAGLSLVFCDGGLTRCLLHLLIESALRSSRADSSVGLSGKLDEDMGMVVVTITTAAQSEFGDIRSSDEPQRAGIGSPEWPFVNAKHLVETQGGDIWMNPRGPGGATICFSLPPVNRVAV